MTRNGHSLTQRLRAATHDLHRIAEQSGMMRAMLRGQISRAEYVLLLRNLHALYTTLEHALEQHAASPAIAPLRMPLLDRSAALALDLDHHHGAGWRTLPVTREMLAYVSRLEEISKSRPALLAAHAYVRYLGDLSGGQMLSEMIGRAFGMPDNAGTAFYAFGDAAQVGALKEQFRAALDGLPLDPASADAVVAEAQAAFERHVALFMELDQAARGAAQDSIPPPAA
jgi:heme oxygenase